MICSFCREEIDPTLDGVWQKITGWEKRRNQGGTNAIAMREPLQEFMHATCMILLKRGLTAQQGSLM